MQREGHNGLHVAIIMDGNGRWATRRGLARIAGHRAGVTAIQRVVERAPDVGIRRLTLYAFSSDNWRRPAFEVESIFWLLRAFLRLECERLRRRGVRLQFIGRRDRLPKAVLTAIDKVEDLTATGDHLHLYVALDYSSRDAITRAAVSAAAVQMGQHLLSSDSIDRVLTEGSGEVDLLIRTGGEKRLSDFLLWESAYAELLFTDCMWPDFDEISLEAALQDFKLRQRRFGGLPAIVSEAACLSASVTL